METIFLSLLGVLVFTMLLLMVVCIIGAIASDISEGQFDRWLQHKSSQWFATPEQKDGDQ